MLLTEAFSIISTLFEGESTCIYCATRKSDHRRVILKTHKRPEDNYKIRYEYDLLSNVNIDGISNVIDLFHNNDNQLYLVSEDKGSLVLENYIKTREFNDTDLMTMLESACESLALIHANHIIHRDIKPSNMLIDPETLKIWFIDFGISLPIKNGSDQRHDSLVGTIEYISPEQTGRTNQPVDQRSDIYSLGVTMYRVLTGSLPFNGIGTAALIHEHVAVNPVAPKNLKPVDDFTSDVIMKMLEKLPENRYQAATSIIYDITRYRAFSAFDNSSQTKNFRIGEKDIFSNLEGSGKLYGKTTYFKTLKDVLENIDDSKVDLALLEGPEASGKTFLLNTFERHIINKHCLVFRGTYDQTDRGEPFYMLRSAFTNLESQLYNMKLSFSTYRDQMVDMLGNNISVLAEILPSMQSVFNLPSGYASDPSYTHLADAMENKLRMDHTFSTFMQILCNIPYTCVFIFDNLQWADRTCLRLIFAAINNSDLRNCLFLFAFRKDGGSASKMLEEHIADVNPNHVEITDLIIGAPSVGEVTEIIIDVFPMERQSAKELARHIISHTEGQIRDISEYLKAMYRTRAIIIDDSNNKWLWNRETSFDEDYSEKAQVLQLYDSFDDKTKSILNLIACVGTYMSKTTLEIVLGGPKSCEKALRIASPFIDAGWFGWNQRIKQYSFSSGRLLALLYHHILPEIRGKCHYMIGKRLYSFYEEDVETLIFQCPTITDQFNRAGIEYIDDIDDISRILRLNLLSGDNASHVSNFDKARRYYDMAYKIYTEITTAGHSGDISKSDLISMRKNMASCMFAQGEREEATAIYKDLIKVATNESERFEFYNILIRHLTSAGEWGSASELIREYLYDTGLLESDTSDPKLLGDLEFMKFDGSSFKNDKNYLLENDLSTDPTVLRNGSMLAMLATNALMNLDPFTKYYIYRAINYGYENKGFPDLERALALASERRAADGNLVRAKGAFDLGLAFSDKFNLSKSTLWASYCAAVAHWDVPFKDIMPLYQKSRKITKMEGNLYYGSFMDAIIVSYSIFAGVRFSKVSKDVDAAAYVAEKNGLDDFRNVFDVCFRQFIRCLSGSTNGLDSFDDMNFCEEKFIASTKETSWSFISMFYYPHRMQALFIHGYYQKVLEYAEAARLCSADADQRGSFLARAYYYFYQTMAIIRLCENDNSLMGKYMGNVYANVDILKRYSVTSNNFDPFYKLVLLELQKLSGLKLTYISEYSELSREFKEMGLYYERCIIEESLAGLWTMKFKVDQYKDIQLQRALELYRAIGARAKVRMLSAHTMDIGMAAEYIPGTGTHHSSSVFTNTAEGSSAMDYQAILDLISVLVSDRNLDEMVEHLLTLLITNAAADQALLFLVEENEIKLFNFIYMDALSHGISSSDLPLALNSIGATMIPHRIIQYIAEKKAIAVANSSDSEFAFLSDPYLDERKPESFIGLPIVANSILLGIIYLENSQLPGIFAPSRVKFLSNIAAQAGLLLRSALDIQSMTKYSEDLEKRLSSYTQQLNTLIGGIAHEINTPLGVCVTLASGLSSQTKEIVKAFEQQTLSKTGLLDYFKESVEGIDILTGNIMRATDLVQNFKRVTVNQSVKAFEEIDIIQELKNIVDYVRPAMKNIIGSCTMQGPDMLIMYTSSGALAQVFTNMLMNSAIHAFGGMPKADCKVEIEINDLPDTVNIIYQDNGRGMTPEEKDQFFIPFFTMRRTEGGSGLGGHIILSMVTQTLGGTIQIFSAPDQGCRFIINLPKAGKLPEDKASGAMKLPEDGVSGTEKLPVDGVSSAKNLPDDKASGAMELPEDGVSGAEKLPADGVSGAEKLPVDKVSGAEELSGDKSSETEKLPEDMVSGARELPEDKVSGAKELQGDRASEAG
ncbi:serine/threonine protein kinase [Clostridia bacterium]|nr:serine/threonine protein kinase [Clostridia bacterium]